ncbi:hypothetical protein [Bacillus sp. V3-13]|nr:hypothetical protein [Bacillus sp. V3-13]
MKDNIKFQKEKDLKTDSYETDVSLKETMHLDYVPDPHGTIGQQITNDSE